MKARRVKGLDPHAPLAEIAERIVAVRLDELCGFWPAVADPAEVAALHDMRIAAKRLRYVLEVTHPCFGPYAAEALKAVKDLQDLLGEIHDCDVQIPDVRAVLDDAIARDAAALALAGGDAADLDPRLVSQAPHLPAHPGLSGLEVHLRARRDLLYRRFLSTWQRLERDGFAARLLYALGERPPEPLDGRGTIGPP